MPFIKHETGDEAISRLAAVVDFAISVAGTVGEAE